MAIISIALLNCGKMVSNLPCMRPPASLVCLTCGAAHHSIRYLSADAGAEPEEGDCEQPLMKPLPDLGSSELRELGAAISQDICSSSPRVAWGDVAGLEGAKHLLREALVMPLQFPDIFTGILAPWKVCI